MIHPTMGETISSYKKLMNNPATMEIWQTAFGKDFGGMAQGYNKMGQKGTNAIFLMTHAEILLIPADPRSCTRESLSIFVRRKQIHITFASQPAETSSTTLASPRHANCRPHLIKTDVEQCPKHQRHKVNVPGHQEFLLDCPLRSVRIHENVALTLPNLE